MADKPCRRFEIRVSVGADTWDEACARLVDLATDLEHVNPSEARMQQSCSGSPSSYTSLTVAESPEQTHEKYIAELDAYLVATREGEKA